MRLEAVYRDAQREEDVARLRRILALRAMLATGTSQREVAQSLGITQPAVSQQLKSAPKLNEVHPEVLLAAARPVLTALAAEHGYAHLSVFGSVARHEARQDSQRPRPRVCAQRFDSAPLPKRGGCKNVYI